MITIARLRILNSQQHITEQKYKKALNTYEEFTADFIEGFINSNSDKIPDTINDATIREWLVNPDDNLEDIISYMTYLYYADGNIYQLYTLLSSLPKLNYKIRTFDKSMQGYEDKLIQCDKILYQVNYKKLTRSLISQLVSTGSVVACWLGNKSNPYLYIFPSDEYVFGGYRVGGEWIAQLDMAKFEEMQETERASKFETFQSLGVERYYKKYERNKDKFKYMPLPQDKTCVMRINTLYIDQMKGLPMGIQSLFDLSHKQTLRALEKDIVAKAIKNIGVLSIGDDSHEFDQINTGLKNKIIKSVQSAISNAQKSNGIPLTILPNFASLTFPEAQGLEGLSDKKFDNVDNSISADIGLSQSLTGGSGSNFQTSKINLSMVYSRIDMILEEIEPIFRKLFSFVLTKQIASNISFEFMKGEPLTNKETLDAITKLGAMGYSMKSIADMLPNTSYTELITDSLYEIETLKLRDKIVPPRTSSTLSAEDSNKGGRPVNENPNSENTVASQESGGNLGGE